MPNPRPHDDDPPDDYQQAMEATLRRLMEFLRSFEIDSPDVVALDAVPARDPLPGALYSIRGSVPGCFQVVKVLAVDEHGVHACLYSNAFERRPTTVAPDLLDTAPFHSLAAEDAGETWPLSVGHLPLLTATFEHMRPAYITRTTVDDDELDGYREWHQAGGGYL
jgi:hypothetical protein